MRAPLPLLLALCTAFLPMIAACDAAFSISPGQVTLKTSQLRVQIANGRETPIFFFLVEGETAAVILWVPCTDPETCDRVDPRRTRTVQATEIVGYEPDAKEGILYWWHLFPTGEGEYTPDEIRSVVFDF